MPLPLRKDEHSFEETVESPEAAAPVASAEERLLDGITSDDIHARALQRRLVEAYGSPTHEPKLPMAQRLGIIVGASAALWGMIGLGIAAVV